MDEMLEARIWSIAETNQGNVILLRPLGIDITVPVFIGQLEMQSILIAREGLSLPRPLTHDLFSTLLRRLKLTLERVEVHELVNNTFHARLVISGGILGEGPLVMDCRPSDAFALAVRRKCPIMIAPTVVEQAGIPMDFFLDVSVGEQLEEAKPPSVEDTYPQSSPPESEKYRKLREQLNQAVAAEEYERAAEIRDILILLENQRKDGEE